jgi:hypothetical protein
MEKDANMKRTVIVAVAAVVLVAGSALTYNAYARYDGWGHGRYHWRMNADDAGAFADARIAALKAGLRLTAEQEKLWPSVESALKELAGKRIARHQERRAEWEARREDSDAPRVNPIERLRKGADRLSEIGADLKRLADATDPLYQSLDESQKRRFDALAHAGMRNWRGMDRHREERGWRRHGEFDGSRHMHEHSRGSDHRGPRDRTEWTAPIPYGAERL